MRLAVLPLGARGASGEIGPLADYLLPFVEARGRLDSLARALDVGLIAGGSIEPSPDGYRVHVELIDPTHGEVLGDTTRIVAVAEEAGLVDALSDAALQLLRQQSHPGATTALRDSELGGVSPGGGGIVGQGRVVQGAADAQAGGFARRPGVRRFGPCRGRGQSAEAAQ
jgi:hypothetical protein